MWVIVHIIFTIALLRVFSISGNYEIILAFVFGVLIDIDHLLKIPGYIKQNGFHIVRYWPLRTSIQEPISYIWVIPLCIILNSWVPFVFFTAHLVLDYIMAYKKRPLWPISKIEFGVENKKRAWRKEWIPQAIVIVLSIALILVA
jgi:hypothetical protein